MAARQQTLERPALARARQVLAGAIDACRVHAQFALPTLPALAAAARVSRMTMWHALQEARAQRLITASRGQRATLLTTGGPVAPSVVVPVSASPWQQVTSELRRQVLSGTPMPGESLPSVKDLARTHGVCYHTARKAIDALVREGLLQPHGRHARVTDAPPSTRARSDVVLIAFGARGQIPFVTPRTHEHVRILEQECSRINVRLRIFTADQIFDVPGGQQAMLEQLKAMRPLGVVLWRIVYMNDPFRALADLVARSALPFVVLDETGDAHELLPKSRPMRCRVFSMATSASGGRDVGRYLARHGHRQVAFVTSRPDPSGFRGRRLDGLRQALAEAGSPDAVTVFMVDQSERDASLQKFPGLPALLNSVLARDDITTLVAENDPLALECLAGLQQKKVPVPGRISVVGFDDGMAAMLQRMTSYNFGGDNTTRAMLAFLLRPTGRASARDAVTPVELPGRVVERQSSGPAPRRSAAAQEN